MTVVFQKPLLLVLICAFALAFSLQSHADGLCDTFYKDIVDRSNSESEILWELDRSAVSASNINTICPLGKDSDDSVLRVAVYRRFETLVSQLLSLGANPNLILENTCSPLGTAIINEDEPVIRLLLKYGADTREPMCWSEEHREIPIDKGIVSHNISDEIRIEIMMRKAELGAGLSPTILVFAIVNDKLELATAFVELMPDYRNKTFLALAEPRSTRIYQMLRTEWDGI